MVPSESPGNAPPDTSNLHLVAPGSRHTWAILLAAFAGYSLLAVLVTRPLVLHLSSHVPKDLEDSLWYPTTLWWNAHVMPLSERWWNGFTFYPSTGAMAFSDHLLGASLIASPLQWLGWSPVTAYNLTFLASFPLCAIGAHVLGLALTRRHDAALVCGLAYGFNPYRVAHLEHLELLMAFGMPVALAALHLYTATRRSKWLVVLAAALTLQALCASYYALFFTVLMGMWMLWFIRPHAWRRALMIAATGGVSALALSPIVFGYSRIHQDHHLARDFAEVLTYSADMSSFVTASALSTLWGWTAPLNGGERQLFPGLTIAALALGGAVLSWRLRRAERDSLAMPSKICWAVSACFVLVAVAARVAGPWQLDWGWLRISVSVPHKPLSVAAVFGIGAIALSPTVRAAFRKRSALAFYLVAAAVLFLCSLGPRPTFLGVQALYEPPYAWLMRLPFFADGTVPVPAVRVPARFAMLAVLALSVAGGLAFARLTSSRRHRVALAMAVTAGIVADGWTAGLPLVEPPSGFRIPPENQPMAVLELPLGETRGDTAAMYRATLHGRPVVNGYHSYAPLSHQVLRLALTDRDPTALEALAAFGPLLIAVDNANDPNRTWRSFVSAHPGVTRIAGGNDWTLFQLPRRRAPSNHCENRPVTIAGVFDQHGKVDTASTDEEAPGWWIASYPLRASDSLTLQLGGVERLCGLMLSVGAAADFYPRTLRVAKSLDGVTWETRFTGKMGGATFLAALDNPRNVQMFVPLSGKAARFVTLRNEQPLHPWAVADVRVHARR